MIGQKRNLETIKSWRLSRKTPRFILLDGVGERLELAKEVAKSLNAEFIIADKSVADVRAIINNSYSVTQTTFYIFENGDDMSIAAQNAILKVVEEPPNNAYFIMLCNDMYSMLPTIRNRSTKMSMDFYTQDDIREVSKDELINRYCFDVVSAKQARDNYDKFKQLVEKAEKFANEIKTISGVEALKIMGEVSGDREYPIGISQFITIANRIILEMILETVPKDVLKISIVSSASIEAQRDLWKKGIKKDSVLDIWALDVRSAFQ